MNNDFLKDVFSDIISTNTTQTEQPPIGDPVVDSNVIDTTSTSTDPNVVPSTEQVDDNVAVQPQDTNQATPDNPAADAKDFDWETFIEDSTASANEPTTAIDYSHVGKALGIEVKGVEDIAKFVETLKTENTKLKESSLKTEELPSDLKDAIDVWKNQGDYRAIFEVDSIDYSVLDPVEIFEMEVQDFFENPDGTFREKEYYDYIDSLDPTDKKLRGLQIQKQLMAEQNYQKQALKQKVEKEKVENLRQLEQSLGKFDKVGDYTVTPKIKQALYQDISSGKFLDEMGVKLTGAHQFDKLLGMYFKAKYFDAIQKFNEQRTRTSTLRQEIGKIGNHTVNQPAKLGNPTETQKRDGIDMYFDFKGIKR